MLEKKSTSDSHNTIIDRFRYFLPPKNRIGRSSEMQWIIVETNISKNPQIIRTIRIIHIVIISAPTRDLKHFSQGKANNDTNNTNIAYGDDIRSTQWHKLFVYYE